MTNLTKAAIKSCFLRLLDQKPLSQISVKLLVQECGINRNTFYYHYEDLPALIEEIIVEEMDRVIAQYPDVDSIETAIRALLELASENRKALLHIYNSVNRDIFERNLWRMCDHLILSYSRSLPSDRDEDQADRMAIIHFYKCAFFGLTIDWLDSGCSPGHSGLLARLCGLHRGVPELMLERSRRS